MWVVASPSPLHTDHMSGTPSPLSASRSESVSGVRLNVVSVDGTHGFQVKALGLNAGIPAGGRTVTVELTQTEVGTFEINCSTDAVMAA